MITREEIEKALKDYNEEVMQKLKITVILDLRDQVAELAKSIDSLKEIIEREGLK